MRVGASSPAWRRMSSRPGAGLPSTRTRADVSETPGESCTSRGISETSVRSVKSTFEEGRGRILMRVVGSRKTGADSKTPPPGMSARSRSARFPGFCPVKSTTARPVSEKSASSGSSSRRTAYFLAARSPFGVASRVSVSVSGFSERDADREKRRRGNLLYHDISDLEGLAGTVDGGKGETVNGAVVGGRRPLDGEAISGPNIACERRGSRRFLMRMEAMCFFGVESALEK